jgi:hypothetical protein
LHRSWNRSEPSEGIYIAAYTAELNGLFYEYAKLSTVRPDDVWTAEAMLKVTARSGYAEEATALRAVHDRALRWVSEVQPPQNKGFWSQLIARARRRR